MGLSCAKDIALISSAVCAQCTNVTERQTDKSRNGNIEMRSYLSAKLPKTSQFIVIKKVSFIAAKIAGQLNNSIK